ncbi:CDP-diacylglycerol-serine O-phosphatidyltransferase, partial [Coemansia sp. RSA 25]
LILASPVQFALAQLAPFESMLFDVIGFFVVEHGILASAPDFRSKADVDTLWDAGIAKLSDIIARSIQTIRGDPAISQALQGSLTTFTYVMEENAYDVRKLRELMMAIFGVYDPELPSRFSMVRSFQLADFVTLGNGVCGCLSLMFAMKALITQNTDFLFTSFWCIPAGVLFDFLDGRVARWKNSSSLLGQELDSLADFCSFGIAPAVLGFACGFQKMLDLVVLTYFVCCGLARLARYNATVAAMPTDLNGKVKFFEGTPIPTTLVIVGVLAYGVHCGKFWRFANPMYQHEGPFALFSEAFTPDYLSAAKHVDGMVGLKGHLPKQRDVSRFMENKVQANNFTTNDAMKKVRANRAADVRDNFLRAWRAYKKYAYGSDEINPLTLEAVTTRNGWGATLIDSLDTIHIMGLDDEFKEATEKVRSINFDKNDGEPSKVFETNIRYIGGLISAYELSNDKIFLTQATALADIMLEAFDTPTGIPWQMWDVQTGTGSSET